MIEFDFNSTVLDQLEVNTVVQNELVIYSTLELDAQFTTHLTMELDACE